MIEFRNLKWSVKVIIKNVLSCLSIGLIMAVSFDGCAKVEVGNKMTLNIKDDKDIIVGKTTKNDIIARYGQSNSSVVTADSEIMTYSYTHSNAQANPIAYVPIVGLFAIASGNTGKAQSSSVSYSFIFDLNGILKNKISSSSGSSTVSY